MHHFCYTHDMLQFKAEKLLSPNIVDFFLTIQNTFHTFKRIPSATARCCFPLLFSVRAFLIWIPSSA